MSVEAPAVLGQGEAGVVEKRLELGRIELTMGELDAARRRGGAAGLAAHA